MKNKNISHPIFMLLKENWRETFHKNWNGVILDYSIQVFSLIFMNWMEILVKCMQAIRWGKAAPQDLFHHFQFRSA